MKIAILIMLHKYTIQQKKLIEHLSNDFEIYIHIDKKSNISKKQINIKNVHIYKKYRVYWGSYNQIRATLYLFNKAHKHSVSRYIFISGDDIPIKSNSDIIKKFENNEKNYLSVFSLPEKWKSRIEYYYLNYSNPENYSLKISKKLIHYKELLNSLFIKWCKEKEIKRNQFLNIPLFAGANWMDLTDKCVTLILEYLKNNKKFLKHFKYTRCADELFFQTIIKNLNEKVEIENKLLRYIEWDNGSNHPKVFRNEDYTKLITSDCLFARKVDIDIDENLINRIYNYLKLR